IQCVSRRFAISENDLGKSLYETLKGVGLLRADRGILVEELFIKIAAASDPIWISPRGNRPHLHFSGGICTHSLDALKSLPVRICCEMWESNYLSYNALISSRPP